MKIFKKIALFVLAGVLWAEAGTLRAFADTDFTPYQSYIYNRKNEAVAIPNCFVPRGYLDGETWSVGPLNAPEDLSTDETGRIFVADTGNNRIIVAQPDGRTATVLSEFRFRGEILSLNAPLGVFGTADRIYVCDTGNRRVLISDFKGNVFRILEKPTAAEFEQDWDFIPRKAAADRNGNVYVLCENVYAGAVVFNADGEFGGFYGSNRVQPTAEILIRQAFKKIMNKDQRRKMAKYVPAEFENLTIRGNFIYTVSYETNTGSINLNAAVRKLNPAGSNVTDTDVSFGDLDMYYDYELKGSVYTRFCDLYVDSDEYLYALDATAGKIFVYDSEYRLLCVFGGLGEQAGLFRYPAAVGESGGRLLVLDRGKGIVTVFESTAFFEKVRKAEALFKKGLYREAEEPWNEVLRLCGNYTLAHTGIGKARFQQGDFAGAMESFRKSADRAEYSEAFKYYRLRFLRSHFTAIFVATVLSAFLVVMFRLRFRRPLRRHMEKMVRRIPERARFYLRFPVYCMRHPYRGFEELKEKGGASYLLSGICVLLRFAAGVSDKSAKAFIFNPTATAELKINIIFLSTVVPYVLFVLANLGLRTFMAGRGTLREICAVGAYSLLPLTLSLYVNVGLSYLLTREESMFMTMITAVGLLWSAAMLFFGVGEIHEYDAGETVRSILLTGLGMVLIVFLTVLFYGSLQQAFSWLGTVFTELKYRHS